MSFRKNGVQQISFDDSFDQLTKREKGFMEKSWAHSFARKIFPAIDEEPFRVLYDSGYSRPNTPVNVMVGALILKELHGLSDDELLENLLLDVRYQYALHTTSCKEQPLSDRSLGRFRARCARYAEETGRDLMQECLLSLAESLAELMGISGRLRRMDSMMIAANIRRLGRLQLIYTCTAGVVRAAAEAQVPVPEELQHYLDANDYNRLFYHTASDKNEELQKAVLAEGNLALTLGGESAKLKEKLSLLRRCLGEQTIVREDGSRLLASAEDKEMHAEILQNPADPDASWRQKAGKTHQGYVANLEESVGENGSIITDYQLEKNTYSDSRFVKDRLERMEPADKPVTMIADGGYAGQENKEMAAQKNVELITTDLNGRAPDRVVAEFELNEEGTAVVRCPAGHTPLRNGRIQKNGQFMVTFRREDCAQCPHRSACRAKVHKKVSNVPMSQAKHARAQYAKFMETEEFRACPRLRNGVETVPSSLRRNQHADRMPVRGLVRSRLVFGCKVAAYNVRKFLNFVWGKGKYAQNPLITAGR